MGIYSWIHLMIGMLLFSGGFVLMLMGVRDILHGLW